MSHANSDNLLHLLDDLPPVHVIWLTVFADTLCYPLQCSGWRDTLNINQDDSWFAAKHKVPPLVPHLPQMLSYSDFFQQQQQGATTATSAAADANNYWSSQSLYQYAFQTESTALGNLGTPTAAAVLVLLVLLIRSIKHFLLPIFSAAGRSAGRRTHGPSWEATNEVRIVKFGEYVFRLLYHSAISAYGVFYFWDKPWWAAGGTLSLFQGFPNHAVEPGMTWYYLLQAAYNLDAFLALMELSFKIQVHYGPFANVQTTADSSGNDDKTMKQQRQSLWPVTIAWRETVRGDFQEMFVHHLITNGLVFLSSFCRVTRVGSMVFLVHDLSDVPVDLSKLANFLKYKVTTAVCFFLMVAVWMATRLYILPVTIYGAILTESHYYMETGDVPPILYACYRPFFYVGIGLLILLHAAWFVMFLRMGYLLVFKNETHDLSEHKKGESQSIYGSPGRKNGGKGRAATNGSKARAIRSTGDEKKDD